MYVFRHYANAIINLSKYALALRFRLCIAWIWDIIVWTADSLSLISSRSRKVECDCCEWRGDRYFLQTYISGNKVHRSREFCPRCLSLERQRQLVRFLKNKTRFISFESPVVLDIGPGKAELRWFKNHGYDIVTTDIMSGMAKVIMDLNRLGFKDDVFDVIMCSHVLEHVTDDIAGMKEILRVMKQGCICIIQVPVQPGLAETVEYGRSKAEEFGHFRSYGRDFASRLSYAGFEIVYSENGLFQVTKPYQDHKSI